MLYLLPSPSPPLDSLPPHPCPSTTLPNSCPILVSVPFHLLFDCFSWLLRARSSLFLTHHLPLRACFLSSTTAPGGGLETTGFKTQGFPVKVTPTAQPTSVLCQAWEGLGSSLPNPAAIASVHLIFTTDRTFHGELDAHSTGNENFMTVLTRSCRLHQLRKHGCKRTTCEL